MRGLEGGTTLAKLLRDFRGRLHQRLPPLLTIPQVLGYADAHFKRKGEWPGGHTPGQIPNGPKGLTWVAIQLALIRGARGLPAGMSVAKLLEQYRGVRNQRALPVMTEQKILRWADDHHARTGDWPKHKSGAIAAVPGETWLAVESALAKGFRGLPGGDSLAKFLDRHRGVRNHCDLPPLTHEQILGWADAYHARTGAWPSKASGRVKESPVEEWRTIDSALFMGYRGLPKGVSLARLLAEYRGVRHPTEAPRLTIKQILSWADAHHDRTGSLPFASSGPIVDALGETWAAVEAALSAGIRGLPGGDSLARFLARHRGKRNSADLPLLTVNQVKGWIAAFHRRTGAWPTQLSGLIPGTKGECWNGIDRALTRGRRGLPGGMSLATLKREMPGFR